MAETGYEAHAAVLRLAVPDSPAVLADTAGRLAAMTAGAAVLEPEGTEWVDLPP
jgi:hypothetical protein